MKSKLISAGRAWVNIFLLVLLIVMASAAGVAHAETTSVSGFTGSAYTHNSVFDNAVIIDGVDVSYVQKNNVNWKKAKADGVDFAIIRVGARGYGEAGRLIEDDYYKENIEAAQKAGIMVGVYFFSQAVDPLEAYAEANYTLELIEGYDLDLPVYMDYEFASDKYNPGRLNTAQLSKLKMTRNAERFCETIEEGGYRAGFYANRNFLNKTVDGKALGEKWPVWLAQYNTSSDYAGKYHMWQYSSSGSIAGYNGRVDVNFMYMDPKPAATSTKSIAESTVSLAGDPVFTYSYGTLSKPEVEVTQYGMPLTRGVDYKTYYLKNANAGTGYVLVQGIGEYTDYQLIPFGINPSADLSGISVGSLPDFTYNGKIQRPNDLNITDAYGNRLVKNQDYTFTVKNAKNVGQATVTVEFKGNYSGKKTLTYNILPGVQTMTSSAECYNVRLEDGPFTLDGIQTLFPAALTYSSDNEAVATVDADGTVTPLGSGTAMITVTSEASEQFGAASIGITVNVSKPVQTIITSADSYTKTRLAKSFFLGAVAEGGSKLTYESTNTSVAKVNSDGRVMLMGPGTAAIIIRGEDTETFAAGEKQVSVKVKTMAADAYQAKYDKTRAGVEGTKIVTLKSYPEKKKVKLTWKKSNSGYAVDYYQVWRSDKKSSGYSKVYTSADADTKYFVHTENVEPGTAYWYKVRGVRNMEGKLVYTPFTKIQVTTPKK